MGNAFLPPSCICCFLSGVEVFGVFNAATQLVDKYSPHCLTGIVVGFTTGVALKCIEQQFASSDHDPQEDDSCCTGTAPAGNDDSPTTAPDGTSLPDKKQHDGQSNIVLSTLAESKGQERKSPESRALHLHRKRLNGGRSRKARNRESRGAAKLLKATSGTKLRTESQTMLLRYGVLGRRRRRTIGFVLMGYVAWSLLQRKGVDFVIAEDAVGRRVFFFFFCDTVRFGNVFLLLLLLHKQDAPLHSRWCLPHWRFSSCSWCTPGFCRL